MNDAREREQERRGDFLREIGIPERKFQEKNAALSETERERGGESLRSRKPEKHILGRSASQHAA